MPMLSARALGALLRTLAAACLLGLFSPALGRAQPSLAAELDHPGVVNLNTASAEELIRLPGVGPARARAILELRARLTRFSRIEELLRVKGIGRATFRKLRPMLTLAGPTTLRER